MIMIRNVSPCIVVVVAMFGIAGHAAAQVTQPTSAEKKLAGQIKCEDFKKNANGSWTSGPNAKIGTNVYSNTTFGVRGISLDGADVAIVLEQKCGGRPL